MKENTKDLTKIKERMEEILGWDSVSIKEKLDSIMVEFEYFGKKENHDKN